MGDQISVRNAQQFRKLLCQIKVEITRYPAVINLNLRNGCCDECVLLVGKEDRFNSAIIRLLHDNHPPV